MKSIHILIVVVALIVGGCQSLSNFLQDDDNRWELVQLIKPYVSDECRELKVAPVYSVSADDQSIVHTGGFLIGGCGTLVELSCDLQKPKGERCSSLVAWKTGSGLP